MGKVDVAGTKARQRRAVGDSIRFSHSRTCACGQLFWRSCRRHVSFLARTSYLPLRMRANDGTVLLPDMILPGGVTLTELGSDHFMRRKPSILSLRPWRLP